MKINLKDVKLITSKEYMDLENPEFKGQNGIPSRYYSLQNT